MTVAKIACAIVSCATALMLVHIIPDLLSVKTRELFLKNKAEELDREMGLILTQEETGRHVRMQYLPPEVVAVRVPLLHLSNFQINDWPELSAKSYAVMVLILPTESARKWRDHELELVEVVADQFRFVTGVVPGKEIKFVVVAKEQNTAHINTRFCTGTQVTKLTVNS
ncbi:hypothetical protein NC652_036574 [Populus alba x Populus x berolinensis]|uniref:Uncharacterized protein n=1 Tax=Populus alba x Populus x berolinensis TaxID=444605 RepID=A0AAD6RHP5_9ROSI|nr:hypothetical protein NC652_036574 [Populus alba x Populus x berolinensis]KAJ7009209.1 hypothetical protein NC653_007747 [Populus alba x Populus x berolinensis]